MQTLFVVSFVYIGMQVVSETTEKSHVYTMGTAVRDRRYVPASPRCVPCLHISFTRSLMYSLMYSLPARDYTIGCLCSS